MLQAQCIALAEQGLSVGPSARIGRGESRSGPKGRCMELGEFIRDGTGDAWRGTAVGALGTVRCLTGALTGPGNPSALVCTKLSWGKVG